MVQPTAICRTLGARAVEPQPSEKAVHIVGRYAVYDAIAAGGMATVHYGRLLGPVGFSRTVAIKRLHTQFARDPEFVSMFLDEARLAARIRHPNVVPTLDVVATDGELFLVMEYVPGESLARLVRTAATLGMIVPPRIVVAIMCGVLRGLHAAHDATNERGEPLGIVHRDVSPQNVLVGIDGQARVLDFGVAKAAGRLQTTRDGKLKGKLAYMAPEQLRGRELDRRTDVFAASVVLWESLTGRRLFKGDNEGAIVTKILEGGVIAPSAAVPLDETDDAARANLLACDAITLKGLAPHPADRFESARAMAIALERAVPPAGVSEVSEWVEQFAKEILLSRAQQVADIESSSAVGPASLRQIRDQDVGLATRNADGEATVSGSVRVNAPMESSRSGKVDLSTISVASQAQRSLVPPPRSAAFWITGALFAGLTLVGAFLGVRSLGNAPRTTSASTPLNSAPTASSSSAAAVPPVTSAAPAVPAASIAAVTSPPSDTGARAPSATPTPPKAVHVAAPTPAPHPATNCSPPYTYDAQGLKHFKPECL